MSRQELDRPLFDRVWTLGAKAVKDQRISALADAIATKPTLEQYQDSHGVRQSNMIKVIKLGILKLCETGELRES